MSETATMTITEFLLARIAEDEEAARDAGADAMAGWRWKHYPQDAYEEVQSLTLAHSRRVLAECEAKRRIVEDCYVADCVEDDLAVVMERDRATPYVGERILRALALPYADHPDYDESWRP